MGYDDKKVVTTLFPFIPRLLATNLLVRSYPHEVMDLSMSVPLLTRGNNGAGRNAGRSPPAGGGHSPTPPY